MLDVGDKAPQFCVPADGGDEIASTTLAGKRYVIYFYPKDQTPGCTTEACDFRDRFEAIAKTGTTVLGVSKDSVKSHDRFVAKHDLPFKLLSDVELEVHKGFGAWGLKKLYGREYEGTLRSTFIVNGDGIITHVWPKVRVKGHVDAVLEALQQS